MGEALIQTAIYPTVGGTSNAQLIPGVSSAATARQGYLHLVALSAGSAQSTVTIWDSFQTSGAVTGGSVQLALLQASTTSNQTIIIDLSRLPYSKGLYAVTTGTGATTQITYE